MSQIELERLQAVNRFLKLNISKEKEIQEIVKLAAEICQTPTALVTLLDHDTQYIKFKVGFDLETTTRRDAFCNHIIEQYEVMVVPDALKDERFVNSSLVTGNPNIRFYAGSPLTTQDGHNLGSLCVVDQIPKQLSSSQQQMLRILSKQVINLLEFDSSLKILKEQFIEAKSSENKLRSFFESFASCYLLIGKNLEILDYNKASANFVESKYHVKINTGMKVIDYIHQPLSEFINNYNKALNGMSVQTDQLVEYEDDEIWWSFTFAPARNPEGEVIGVSFKATDITIRVEAAQKIIKQNASLKQIAYIQSHELRKPVASIMGFMNIFKQDSYSTTKEELIMLEKAVNELDEKIRLIVNYTEDPVLV
jgi:PAS domain S-box-containing protein